MPTSTNSKYNNIKPLQVYTHFGFSWTEPQLTTEYISLDELAMEGPFLPEPMKGHCLLRINSSLDYLIHGVAGKTWFHRNETFEVGQVLLERRVNTQCGLVVIPEDGRVIVVVTGT